MRYSIFLIFLMISPFFIPYDNAVIVPHQGDGVTEASKGSITLPYPTMEHTVQYVGDIDGDDLYDLIIPYPDHLNGSGSVAIYSSRSNRSPIFISSATNGSDFGCLVIADRDIDGDGVAEIMVLNGSGCLYIYTGREIWNNMSSDDADLLILNCSSKLAVYDLNNDDRDDIVTYCEGSIFIHYGPELDSIPLDIPLSDVPELITGGDIDGDGTMELILLSSPFGTSSIAIYDDLFEGAPIDISFGFNISSLYVGDRNDDSKDDLIVTIPQYTSHGAISTLLSPVNVDVINYTDLSVSIMGDENDPLNGSIELMLKDIDGDGLDDLFISNPHHDGGRGKIYSFFSNPGESGDIGIDDSDSYIVGDLPDSLLGNFISVSIDSDGDHLSELHVSSDTELFTLDLARNSPPGEVEELGFFSSESTHGGPYVQDGDDLLLWLRCEDRSSKTKDVARVMISNGNRTTYKLLHETSRSSGLFLGEIKLGNGSINDRSIYSLPNDTIELRYDDLEKSIPVFGNIWSDDPPVFVKPPLDTFSFHVGEPMEMNISGLDPDGGEVTLHSEEMPTWMTLDDWKLLGTPSDGDVGSGEIVLKLSDGEDITELRFGYSVTMPIPSIELPDGPFEPLEGLRYRLDIGISGIVKDTLLEFNSTGPQDMSWMTFHQEGFIEGVPTNRDVGLWSILLTITNPGDIIKKTSWSIEVINTRPDITAPVAVSTDIYEALSIDILSSYEGDGLTFYTVEGPEGVAIAPVSGLISWSPDSSQVGTHLVNVSVFDGHGEINYWVIQIDVSDPPLELLTDLPTVISSHHYLSITINSRGKGTVNYTYEGLPHWMELDRGNNTLSGVPWNIDSGEHPVTISISDSTGRVRRIIWNLSVIPNHQMRDPSISITSYDIDDGKLNVTFAILNLTRPLSSITLTLIDSRGISVIFPSENLSIEPFSIDIHDMNDPITVYLEAAIDGRKINTTTTISKVNEDKVEEYSFTWLLPTLLLIIFISSLAILLYVERTSYPIQKYIFAGGDVREKDLIPIIQHKPGIRYREISNEVSMTRREILATLSHLERSSEVRTMVIGSSVRFYPTVGSFVDGRLVLNRQEIKIIRELLDVRNMGEERLLEETGLHLQKLRRYSGILDLKGIITISTSGKERRYSLSRGQRSTVKIYMGGQEN